jgi:hypothetical protein
MKALCPFRMLEHTGLSKGLGAPDDYSTKITQKYVFEKSPSQNTFGMWTMLY